MKPEHPKNKNIYIICIYIIYLHNAQAKIQRVLLCIGNKAVQLKITLSQWIIKVRGGIDGRGMGVGVPRLKKWVAPFRRLLLDFLKMD